ncbi:hypothetical protein ACVW2L_001450 [Mucilaginibacter sp. HD30]
MGDLRAYVREKLIKFIRENHLQALPRTRIAPDVQS